MKKLCLAAYPEELASRLVQLFSFAGETVLDPFLGSGTTSKVAATYGRNSIGYELNYSIREKILAKISSADSVRLETEKRHDCIAQLLVEETPTAARPRQSLR